MSRVAKAPVELPQGVEFNLSGRTASVKGSKGQLSIEVNSEVELKHEDNNQNHIEKMYGKMTMKINVEKKNKKTVT